MAPTNAGQVMGAVLMPVLVAMADFSSVISGELGAGAHRVRSHPGGEGHQARGAVRYSAMNSAHCSVAIAGSERRP